VVGESSQVDRGYKIRTYFAPLYLIFYVLLGELKQRLVVETSVESEFNSHFISDLPRQLLASVLGVERFGRNHSTDASCVSEFLYVTDNRR
jgi:hypothetical protein